MTEQDEIRRLKQRSNAQVKCDKATKNEAEEAVL